MLWSMGSRVRHDSATEQQLTLNTGISYDRQFHSPVYTKEKCVPLCAKRHIQENEQQHTPNSPKLRTT